MSIKRAYALQDTYIDEYSLTANLGRSPILQVHNIYNSVRNRKEFARIFMKFNLSALTADIAANNTPDPRTDTTVSAYLYVFNAKHGDGQATSFNLDVHPLTQEWDEGVGLDIEGLSNTGYANCLSAQSTVAWTTTGGTFTIDSNSATQSFDHGEEDLKVNITNLFNEWLNGNTGNFGVVIKMASAQEDKTTSSLSSQSHNYKKFYGRETNTTKAPYLQLEYDGSIRDDRNAIPFSDTGTLYFYNIRNGQLQDLAGSSAFPGNVTLSGLSGSSWSAITTALTAARHSKGVYKCNIGTLPLSANNYSSFKDNWYLSASPTANYTFDFTAINPASGMDNFVTSKYRITFKNFQRVYEKGSKPRIRLHIKDDSLTFTALTAATTAISNFICTDGTIEIRETSTDEIEIPAYNLSYDKNGNFFEIDTNVLYSNIEYKPVLKMNIRGEIINVDVPEKYSFVVR